MVINMQTCQAQLAKLVLNGLQESRKFESVSLYGSVATSGYDELSDIDILVTNSARSPRENVELASQILQQEFDVLLNGWSLALLPDKHLISHFLADASIFWWVDIACFQDDHYAPVLRHEVDQDDNEHIAKLWIMNAKHYLRSTDSRLKIRSLYAKVFGDFRPYPGDIMAFNEVLDSVDFHKLDRRFSNQCLQVMHRIEGLLDG
jgi:predicted nucleotidyltransferase